MKVLNIKNVMIFISIMFTVLFYYNSDAYSHCDTLEGPVVAAARAALDSGDVTPLLKWVSAEEEENIKSAFNHTLAVRNLGEEAERLADMYFFETLVRIHRAGEGAPYTGLKSGASIDPAVVLADKAIENGSVKKLVEVLTRALDESMRDRFERVMETRKHSDESVEKGRRFVEAYVQFTHYVEGIHGVVKEGKAPHQDP